MGSMMFQASEVKKLFPELQQRIENKPICYLDSAASALKPQMVIDRLNKFYTHEASNVHRGAHHLSNKATEYYELARELVKDFINAKNTNEIIFTSGTTDSINLVAYSFLQCLSPGDEILISQMEHHSNIVPWQRVAKIFNLKVKFLPLDSQGQISLEDLKSSLSEKTKIVALTLVSNVTGIINPVKEIAQILRQKKIKFLVDAAQAVTSMKIDVQDIDCDFLAFSAHKFYGPYGVGVLFGREEILNEMPPFRCGGSMISDVKLDGSEYLLSPHRFEAGTPHIAGAIGLGEVVKFFNQFDIKEVHAHKKNLLDLLIARLDEISDVNILARNAEAKVAVCSMNVDGVHSSDLATIIDKEGVAIRAGHHCAQPLMRHFNVSGTLRASFDIYNDEADVDRFIAALEKAKGFFK